jgi:hypothetical protein
VYDAFVLLLGIIGIATAIVYSQKIARGTARAVGIVREWPQTRSIVEQPQEHGGPLNVPGQMTADSAATFSRPTRKMRRCEECGLYQHRGDETRCRGCNSPLKAAFAGQVVEKDEARNRLQHTKRLELHDKLLQDLDKRMRQLEIDSLKKSQEASEEAPQLAQADYIN